MVAGELARYLLGRVESPENEAIKKIAEAFNISLGILKEDKEAKTHMNVVDKYLAEGREQGMELKATQTAERLLKNGIK